MAMQRLFARAVDHFLPSAIPTMLERHEDFSLGAVLHYKKKPKPFMPWRKNELYFSDCSLTDLLAEGQQLKFAAMSNFLFDAKSAENISLYENPELLDSLEELKVNTAGVVEIVTDLGRITHFVSDIFTLLLAQKVRLDTSHPVVKEAMSKGSTVFVISTLYQTEHLCMKVAADGATVADAPVMEFNGTTTIAYLLLGLGIDSDGTLSPKLNTGLSLKSSLDIEKSPLLTKRKVVTAGKEESGEEEVDSADVPVIMVKTTEEDDWVNIDFRSEEVTATSDEAPLPQPSGGSLPPQPSEGPPPPTVSPIPSHEDPEGPIRPIPKTLMSRLSNTELDSLYLHSLRDFTQFRSRTYDGVVKEARHWVEPLRSREALRVAFIEYTAPRFAYQRLEKLSAYLRGVAECLRKREAYPPNTNPDFTPVLDKLSQSWSRKLEQVTAMLYAAEACMDFPQHTLKKAFALKPQKKAKIIELIRHTPYGTNQHVYTDAGPFQDPDIYPVLNKVGFSLSGTKLMFVAPDDDDVETEDILVATIIVLYISNPKTV